jgi:hypothetical protein
MVRIFALALLFSGATFLQAHATEDPPSLCAPASVALMFLDQQGRDAVRVELRAPTQTCTGYDADEAVGVYKEPEMRIDFYGKAIKVPNSCLMDFAFRLNDLKATVSERSVVIRILGKLIGHDIRMRAVVIHTVDNNKTSCSLAAD